MYDSARCVDTATTYACCASVSFGWPCDEMTYHATATTPPIAAAQTTNSTRLKPCSDVGRLLTQSPPGVRVPLRQRSHCTVCRDHRHTRGGSEYGQRSVVCGGTTSGHRSVFSASAR